MSIADGSGNFQKKCFCRSQHANVICQHCIAVRYSLNFLCQKICIDKPGYFLKNSLVEYLKKDVPEASRINALGEYLRKIDVTPLDDYLKELDSDPFFTLRTTGLRLVWIILQKRCRKKLIQYQYFLDHKVKK